MKAYLLLAIVFLLVSCKDDAQPEPIRLESALLFEDSSPVDGCVEHIQLASDSLPYVPTAASLPIVKRALKDTPYNANSSAHSVLILYIKTGRQTKLACGWSSIQAGELEVLSIVGH